MEISDKFGRKFSKLRVSLTNECNFSCTYCVMDKSRNSNETKPIYQINQSKSLTTEEYLKIIQSIHELTPLDSVRLTGGEPLLYLGLSRLIRGVKELGIREITLTTNGYYLENKAEELKESGINSINVSLDALDEDTFRKMAHKPGLQRVLRGIDAALSIEIKVKVNSVIMRDINHGQVLPLLEYGLSKNVIVRFLELMAMGHLYGTSSPNFFSQEEILKIIKTKYSLEPVERKVSSTANYWQVNNNGYFGIIANESAPFCNDCNRLRLDSNGKIYGCISSSNGLDITKATDQPARFDILKKALSQKQPLKFTGSPIRMLDIGG